MSVGGVGEERVELVGLEEREIHAGVDVAFYLVQDGPVHALPHRLLRDAPALLNQSLVFLQGSLVPGDHLLAVVSIVERHVDPPFYLEIASPPGLPLANPFLICLTILLVLDTITGFALLLVLGLLTLLAHLLLGV